MNIHDHYPARLLRSAGVLVAAGSLLIAACSSGNSAPQVEQSQAATPGSATVDLIGNQHWQMAGVTEQKNPDTNQPALKVISMDRGIVAQDGSAGQQDPAVNLFGTRLQTSGDFSVTAELSAIDQEVAISLYGAPPIVEDEFRAEQATLDMSIEGGSFWVGLSDSNSGDLVEEFDASIQDATTHTLKITDQAGELSFSVDGKDVGSIPDRDIFDTEQVWLGLDARTNGSSFVVNALSAQGESGGSVVAVDTTTQRIAPVADGLAALAQNKRPDFLVGAAVALGPMVSDGEYVKVLGNFNSYTTENVGKFQTIHPQAGNKPESYNFADMDAVVEMAHSSGARVHGHALVFGEANPAWVRQIASDNPEQLEQIMTDHIKTVVGHYKGQVASWDVVNEPLADYDTQPGANGLRQHIWYNSIGPSYIATALRAAHESDPNAELWINEFGLESDPDRFDQMLDLVRSLKQQGVPLTGVGFQSHIDEGDTTDNDKHIDTQMLQSRFDQLKELGLKVRISELDISSENQHAVFADIFQACIQEPACGGVTTWGFTDKYSSAGSLSDNGTFVPGSGLPWDQNVRPLQAHDDIRTILLAKT